MSTTRRTAQAAAAAKPIEVSADLKALMRRLKLGQLLDTLPERLALAATNHLPHHDFLELLLADEVHRRDRQATQRRARNAHLDPPDAAAGLGRFHRGHLRPPVVGRAHLAAVPRRRTQRCSSWARSGSGKRSWPTH